MVIRMTLGEEKLFLKNLPKKLDFELTKSNAVFMRRVKKSAKLRAPRDTGSLAQDIKLKPVRKGKDVKIWKIVVDNPAAAPQEFGFTSHFAPILNSSKMKPGVYFVRKNTPFLRPALEHNLSKFSQQLDKAVGRAIKQK